MIETKFVKLADAASMLGVDEDNMLLAAAENKITAWGLLNEPRNAQKVIYDLETTEPPLILEGRCWRPMFVPLSKFAAGDILKHGKGRVGLLTEEDERGAVWSDKEEEAACITRNAVFFKRDDIVVHTEALREVEQSVNGTPNGPEKPIAASERKSLLIIIAALCEYSAIKPQERGAASQIAKLTEEIGAAVSDDTVRRALARIPNALESRMK